MLLSLARSLPSYDEGFCCEVFLPSLSTDNDAMLRMKYFVIDCCARIQ